MLGGTESDRFDIVENAPMKTADVAITKCWPFVILAVRTHSSRSSFEFCALPLIREMSQDKLLARRMPFNWIRIDQLSLLDGTRDELHSADRFEPTQIA